MFIKNRASEKENFVWDSIELKELILSFFAYYKQKWTIISHKRSGINGLYSDPKGVINDSQQLRSWRYNNQQLHKSGRWKMMINTVLNDWDPYRIIDGQAKVVSILIRPFEFHVSCT